MIKLTIEELDVIYKALSEILELLRDNPGDETNPQLFKRVEFIMNQANIDLTRGAQK